MKLPAENRRAIIVTAAVELANAEGLLAVTFEAVARRCSTKTTTRNVRHYFNRINLLWSAVILDDRSTKMVREEAQAMGVKK